MKFKQLNEAYFTFLLLGEKQFNIDNLVKRSLALSF